MRIVFMGTPDYATTIFKAIQKDVIALFTQPDKAVGRKQILTPPHIKRYVQEAGLDIEVFQPKSLRENLVVQTLKDLKPDFIVVAAYGQILPKEILDITPCINLHASILPKYRGASPIQHALLHGDRVTGVTAMLMDEGLDTGKILGFDVVQIDQKDTAITLFEKLANRAAALTPLVLEHFSSIQPLTQHDVDASYCKKIKKSDGLVDFEDAKELFNRYRAFIVWPSIFLENGLKLKEVDLVEYESCNDGGTILAIQKDGVVVGCQRGSVKISRVQPPSKKEMDALSYIRGRRLGVGDRFF